MPETQIELRREQMEERLGAPPAEWAGRCHEAACAVVELLGADTATVRRGYFTGERHPDAHFYKTPCQHSWVELRDHSIVDPTRFAFTCDPEWPLWHGAGKLVHDEYDIGGCRSEGRAGYPPAPDGELIELTLSSVERVAELLQQPSDLVWLEEDIEHSTILVSKGQLFYLAHLPIIDGAEEMGTLSPFFAPEIFAAIMDAGEGALIPIDRRDWMLPERSEGRSSF